jgi:deoxyribose-phosphate aldolase
MAGSEQRWTAIELARVLDHTLLAPDATGDALDRLCDEAAGFSFAAVCVSGTHVRRCAQRLAGSDVLVCAVVGFPLGAAASAAKAHEARIALEDGARELDMVMNIGALKSGEDDLVRRDIELVVAAAREHGALVKVILELGLLAPAEAQRACALSEAAGARFVKTSTGFGPRGASVEDVAFLRSVLGPATGIKAAGGIRSARFARELLSAGASRLGSSASVAIVREA